MYDVDKMNEFINAAAKAQLEMIDILQELTKKIDKINKQLEELRKQPHVETQVAELSDDVISLSKHLEEMKIKLQAIKK